MENVGHGIFGISGIGRKRKKCEVMIGGERVNISNKCSNAPIVFLFFCFFLGGGGTRDRREKGEKGGERDEGLPTARK